MEVNFMNIILVTALATESVGAVLYNNKSSRDLESTYPMCYICMLSVQHVFVDDLYLYNYYAELWYS